MARVDLFARTEVGCVRERNEGHRRVSVGMNRCVEGRPGVVADETRNPHAVDGRGLGRVERGPDFVESVGSEVGDWICERHPSSTLRRGVADKRPLNTQLLRGCHQGEVCQLRHCRDGWGATLFW